MERIFSKGVSWGLGQYRRFVSPMLPSACRFHPTCSHYAAECFRRFDFLTAFFLGLKRLFKCHPYCEGGIDPVPSVMSHLSLRASAKQSPKFTREIAEPAARGPRKVGREAVSLVCHVVIGHSQQASQ